jgi:uncharacterized tellurite resistance protein B-like protein
MYGDDITIPLAGGSIVVENPQFIRNGGSGRNVPGLTFTLANRTSSAWMSLDLVFDITYVCNGEAHQRTEKVRVGLGWAKDALIKREYHDLAIPLVGKVDGCATESIKATLVSATSLNNERVEVETGGRVGLQGQEVSAGNVETEQKESAKQGEMERGGQASADTEQERRVAENKQKNAAKTARRKRLAEEKQRKQAEADALSAKRRAEEDERAAEARRKNTSNGLSGGAIVLLIVLLVIVVLAKAFRAGTSGRTATGASPPAPTVLPSRPIYATPIEVPPSVSARAAEWVGLNDCVTVAGFRIPGLVYAGQNLRAIKGYDAEPALIDPSKPVAPSTAGFDPASIPYWPSYSAIAPVARHAYLKWHASGRCAPDAPISFAFLYFYGLERRTFHDYRSNTDRGPEYEGILNEVRRLLDLYGANHSFQRYGTAFLEMAQAIHDTVNIDDLPPDFQQLGYDLPYRLKIALGVMTRDGKAIPPSWAAAWVCADPLFPRRTPFSRCNAYFRELFALRYRERWGAGILVKPNQTTLRLEYHPASASFGGPVTASTQVPDITILKEPIGKLRDLGAECTDALDAYSRYLGRNPGTETHPAAMALLPPGLLAESQTEKARLVRENLKAHAASTASLTRDELLQLVKAPIDGVFGKRDAVVLAQYLASVGFGLEPDVRFGGPVPGPTTKIHLFAASPGAPSAPTPAYSVAALIIRLAASVSASDGVTGEDEEQLLRNRIAASLHLSGDERSRLSAHLGWLLAERPGLTGVKGRVESLTAPQRQAISGFLVEVANVDGQVSPAEVQTLGKLYRLLGLNPEKVYSDLHQAATDPVTIEGPTVGTSGFALPIRKPRVKRTGIQLDPARIEAKLRETASVSALLASVFVEESAPPAAVVTRAVDVRECIGGLDVVNSAFLRYLSEKPRWSREELEMAAAERTLLLDGSIEAINDAAFDACDQPLLEGEDPIEVNAAALTSLLERNRTQ